MVSVDHSGEHRGCVTTVL